MADVDLAKQPDELIQLAWNAGIDRKEIIRQGCNAARLLCGRGERSEIVTLFWPVPRPLEAVDRWSDNNPSQISEGVRPFASAVVPACVLGALITHFFVAPHMSEDSGLSAMLGIIAATYVVLCLVFKVLIALTLRRRVARLDEAKALDIVLALLRRGMVARPRLVPVVVNDIREALFKA